jgi:hypothetical protein
MNLLNFVLRFPYEASCKAKSKTYQAKQGIICPLGATLGNHFIFFLYQQFLRQSQSKRNLLD